MTGAPGVWATSSFGDTAHTTAHDLATLGEHMAQCSLGSGRWVAVRCDAGRAWGWVSARRVTSGVALAALAALCVVWL